MLRRAIALTAVVLGVIGLVPVAPASADMHPPPPYVVAGRTADGFAYYNPVVAVPVGGTLTMISADPLDRHNIVSDEFGPDDQPWCTNYAVGACPLFWSRLVSALPASGGPTTEVLGLENLEATELPEFPATYEFYCTLHTEMTGLLVALPAV